MDTAVEIEPPVSVPEFVTPLSSGKATEGFPVKMAAKVNGYPAPEIQWMKDGKKFKPDKSRVTLSKKPEADGTVEMIFKETLPEDAGEYAVVARNPEGETTSSAPLSVRPRMAEGPATAPIFLTPPRDVSVDEGNPFQLSCVISGNPIPDVQWTLNGEPIDPSHAVVNFDGDRVTLNVAHALKSDEGTSNRFNLPFSSHSIVMDAQASTR